MFGFRRSAPRGPVDAVDTIPPVRQLIPLGLQHVLVAYSGMVTVPLLIGLALGLSPRQNAALVTSNVLVSGIATLIQTLGISKVGVRFPLVMGSTFTGIVPAIVVGRNGGLPAVFGATIVAGLVALLIATYFSKLLRFFPPVVTGTLIAIIGLTLLPSVSTLILGPDPSAAGYGSVKRVLLAAATIVLVVAIERFAPRAVSRFAVLISLVLGSVIATPLGLADFSGVAHVAAFGLIQPFGFGWPTFTVAAIVPMLIVQLVNMVESTGDTLAVGQIVGRPTGQPEVARALRADGLATTIAGCLNSLPLVSYGENVGLVGITRVFSRFVVAACGLVLVILGLSPKLGAVAAAIPGPVLGGVGVVMFGTVAAVGIRLLAQADLADGRNQLIVAVSFGAAMMPVGAPGLYQHFPGFLQTVLTSGIAAGGIVAFLLNLLLHELGRAHRTPGG